MRIHLLALIALVCTTGCTSLYGRYGFSEATLGPLTGDPERQSAGCVQLATPAYFGHYGTCWRKWPSNWDACRHSELAPSEPVLSPAGKRARENKPTKKQTSRGLLQQPQVERTPPTGPPKLLSVGEDRRSSSDEELTQKVTRRLVRLVRTNGLQNVSLHVNVVGDIAWVAGEVGTIQDKQLLLDAAHATDGIRTVYHRLDVPTTATSVARPNDSQPTRISSARRVAVPGPYRR